MIPADRWEEGGHLLIEFWTADGSLIDTYRPILGTEKIVFPPVLDGNKLSVEETGDCVIIRGEGFEIPFSKETGLITQAKAGDRVLIEKGPFLNLYINLNHLTGAEVRKAATRFMILEEDWKKSAFSYRQETNGDVYIDLA